MKNSLKKIQNTIEKHSMISPDDRVLVACSGGTDSVCLALAMHALSIPFGIAHLHHGLRKEADSDAAFCEKLAKTLQVPYHFRKADIKTIAKETGVSRETAGREERYAFFSSIDGYTKIATAHHKNDVTETMLMHLIRGSGLKGLCGILPQRGNIIRPLIDLTRAEIEEFVKAFNITPCTDATNFSSAYTRNRIRNDIIPLLLRENEAAVDNICKTATLLQADEEYLQSLAAEHVSQNTICVSALSKMPYPLASRALRLAYQNACGTTKDFELRHIEYILSNLKHHGNIMDLPFDISVISQYGTLIFQKNAQNEAVAFSYPLKINGKTNIPEASTTICCHIANQPAANGICLDYDALSSHAGKLVLRSVQPADKLTPLGMSGSKRISKLFIDLKIPKSQRAKIPLLALDSSVIWVVGHKKSNLYKPTAQTKNYLILWEEKNNA